MRLFSFRRGLRPVKSVIQLEDIDIELRNGLWDALTLMFWRPMAQYGGDSRSWAQGWSFLTFLWHDFYKRPVDTLSIAWRDTHEILRKWFFTAKWYEVYDFIEYCASEFPDHTTAGHFAEFCNQVLEREMAGYRFVDNVLTQITSEDEIISIEKLLETPLTPLHQHIRRGLELMSDRKNPDYRNSIKESISAVEFLCCKIAKHEKATLGQALKVLEDRLGLHRALAAGFSSLYGFTSDAEGIRHSLMDEDTLSFDDAKFMLVSCSAFSNYLIAKCAVAKLSLTDL